MAYNNTKCKQDWELTENSEDKQLPNESWAHFLIRTGKFYQVLLEVCGEIEVNLDELFLKQFGLRCTYDHTDKKQTFLLGMSFARKLDFLKDIDAISKEQFQAIQKWQGKRNELFHTQGWMVPQILTENEREKLIEEGISIVQLTSKILAR